MRKTIFALTLSVFFLSACGAAGGGSTRKPLGPPPPLKPDIEFAQEAVVLLVKGDPRVEEMIDWETFKTFGKDVGSTYSYMPGESAKAAFRKSFIESYSSPFRNSGETMEGLRSWEVESKDESRTIVTASHSPGKTLVFTIVIKDGRQKLSEFTGKQFSR
jgi:hypothetical protein